jgi:hypothetical protein
LPRWRRRLRVSPWSVYRRVQDGTLTATMYAGLADDGREKAAAKLVDAGFGR